jgi:hypothetical protein
MRRDAPIVLMAVDLTERLWIPAPAKCGRRVLAPWPKRRYLWRTTFSRECVASFDELGEVVDPIQIGEAG